MAGGTDGQIHCICRANDPDAIWTDRLHLIECSSDDCSVLWMSDDAGRGVAFGVCSQKINRIKNKISDVFLNLLQW